MEVGRAVPPTHCEADGIAVFLLPMSSLPTACPPTSHFRENLLQHCLTVLISHIHLVCFLNKEKTGRADGREHLAFKTWSLAVTFPQGRWPHGWSEVTGQRTEHLQICVSDSP